MERIVEVGIKRERVLKYLHDHQLDGVCLSSVANFAWFTGGGDSHVENHNKFGVASILFTHDTATVVTSNIESERILKEQLTGVEKEFDLVVFPWYQPEKEADIISGLTRGLSIASDSVRPEMTPLGGDFNRLRYQLTEAEVARLRWLSQRVGSATEAAAHAIQPGMAEHEIEALLAEKIIAESIQPVVMLIAADERNYKYRHPVPGTTHFTQLAKLSNCSRKWGLVVSATRLVHVGALDDVLKSRQTAVAYVDAVLTAETKPGARVGAIIDAAKGAYKKMGFDGEWQQHHQGGAIGYDAREYIGLSSSEEVVKDPQGFSWNPTIAANKSEDTILAAGSGTEFLTMSKDWPLIEVEVNGRPYYRPAILEI